MKEEIKRYIKQYVELEKQKQEILKKLSLEDSIELCFALGDAGLPL